jgi:uncharacterized protein (TIGR02217 family)
VGHFLIRTHTSTLIRFAFGAPMSGFHEIRFPDAIARGATGGPQQDTSIVTTVAGFERRNINWSSPLGRWDVGTGIRSRADLESFIAFFRARQGRAYGFRFKDWSDYRAAGVVIGLGDGSTKSFQLVKRYSSGPADITRVITKPVTGTVALRRDGALVTSGISIAHSTGLVTFTTAPAAGVVITASFEFDLPVRFDTDRMALSLANYERGEWPEIPIVELRP